MQHRSYDPTLLFNFVLVWLCVLCIVQFPEHVDGGVAQTADFALPGTIFSISVDPITRSLFASDSWNNRVLRYPPLDQITASSVPLSVFGQPNFTASGVYPAAADTFQFPRGIWVDLQGTLWVVDYTYHRVLWYRNAASLPNQPPADGVVGQVNYTATTTAPSRYNLLNPTNLCVVSNTLWIADTQHNRVLRFNNADSLPQFNAPADGVIGQPNFTSINAQPNPQGMGGNCAVLYVINFGLLVGDCLYDRVVYYTVAEAQKPFLATAAYEYGRYNFSSTAPVPPVEYVTQGPDGITTSSDGTLFISSPYQHRVLMFPALPPTADMTRPVAVFGQPDLFTTTPGSTLQKVTNARNPLYDELTNTLWVPTANRVLKYSNVILKSTGSQGNNTVPNVDLGFNYRSPNFNLAVPAATYGNSTDRPQVNTNFEGITEIPSGVTGPFQPDGYSITTTTDPNNNLQFTFKTNEPADLDIAYTLFAAPTPLSSAGVDFVGEPGSLKMAISISNWNFTSNTSRLELTLAVVVTPPVTSMTTTDTAGLTIYTLQSSSISITTIRLLKFCVIDNTTNTPITFNLTTSTVTSNATTYALVIRFPYFAGNVFYDPDFSVVVTNSGGDGDDVGWLPYLSIIAVVFIPLVMIIIVVLVVTYCAVKKYRRRVMEEKDLHQINF